MKSKAEWEALAVGLKPDGRAFIDGRRVVTATTSPDISPVTGKSLADVSECGDKEVDLAVVSARTAFEGAWGNMSPGNRKSALQKLAELICITDDQIVLDLECLEIKMRDGCVRISTKSDSSIIGSQGQGRACGRVQGRIELTQSAATSRI